jgi:hypothetical protein
VAASRPTQEGQEDDGYVDWKVELEDTQVFPVLQKRGPACFPAHWMETWHVFSASTSFHTRSSCPAEAGV